MKKFLKDNYILVTILIVASILRLFHLNFQSLWLDEIYTMKMTDPSLSFSNQITQINQMEGFPYIYFIIIKFLHIIFDYSPHVSRFFSAFFGILGVLMSYKFGKLLFNKNVGLISATIVCFSEFSVYTSQDARPYSLYFFSVILSFFYLVKFLRDKSLKTAIIYGLSCGLLLNTNFFSLINLFSQFLIICFVFVFSEKTYKKVLLKYSVFSGLIALLLFIPNYPLLKKLIGFESGWIPAPTNESLTLIFKELLGGSEATIFIIIILFFYYLFDIFKTETKSLKQHLIMGNNKVFGFVILVFWGCVLVMVNYLKSFADTSIMLPRYFISILPVFILIIAAGIELIRINIIKLIVLSTLCFFMFSNLVVVKRNYTSPIKTQFREASQLIINKNKNDEPVFTSLKFWYDYYLNSNGVSFNVIEKPNLETVINDMIANPASIRPFWYTDAHGRPYQLSENAQNFVDNNFYIDENFDGLDAWTKHFILLKDVKLDVDISKYGVLKDNNGSPFKFSIELYENTNQLLNTSGWAYFDNQDATNSKIELVLIKDGKATIIPSQKVNRPDVTSYFESSFDLSNSGFKATFKLKDLPGGIYRLGVLIESKSTNKSGLSLTDKIITINN